jgi:hypothetical protein
VRLQFSGARDSSAATCATSTSRSFPYRAFLHNLTVFDQLRTLEPAEHHREFNIHEPASRRDPDFRYKLERQLVEGAFDLDELDASGRAVATTHAPASASRPSSATSGAVHSRRAASRSGSHATR